jgi:hypothetical protein
MVEFVSGGSSKAGTRIVQNLITDVDGALVGGAEDARVATGVSVVIFDEPAVASIAIRGGAFAMAHCRSPRRRCRQWTRWCSRAARLSGQTHPAVFRPVFWNLAEAIRLVQHA